MRGGAPLRRRERPRRVRDHSHTGARHCWMWTRGSSGARRSRIATHWALATGKSRVPFRPSASRRAATRRAAHHRERAGDLSPGRRLQIRGLGPDRGPLLRRSGLLRRSRGLHGSRRRYCDGRSRFAGKRADLARRCRRECRLPRRCDRFGEYFWNAVARARRRPAERWHGRSLHVHQPAGAPALPRNRIARLDGERVRTGRDLVRDHRAGCDPHLRHALRDDPGPGRVQSIDSRAVPPDAGIRTRDTQYGGRLRLRMDPALRRRPIHDLDSPRHRTRCRRLLRLRGAVSRRRNRSPPRVRHHPRAGAWHGRRGARSHGCPDATCTPTPGPSHVVQVAFPRNRRRRDDRLRDACLRRRPRARRKRRPAILRCPTTRRV